MTSEGEPETKMTDVSNTLVTDRRAMAASWRLFAALVARSFMVSSRDRDLFLNTLAIAILTLGYAAITRTSSARGLCSKVTSLP
jgi:hypothetical protein